MTSCPEGARRRAPHRGGSPRRLRERFPARAPLAALACLALVLSARRAAAAPEAHILRIDPRASSVDGAPILTTVLEIVQNKRMSELTGKCAALVGDATIDVADYHFRPSADQAVPDGIKSIRAEATFLCNNATNRGKNALTKDNGRTLRGLYVTGLGFWQARKLFGGGGGDIKAPSDPRDKPPKDAQDQSDQLPKGDPKDSVPDDLRDRIKDADKNGVPKSSTDKLKDLPPDIRKDVDDELKKRPQLEDPKPKKG